MSEDYIAKSPGSLLGVSDVKMEFVNGLMVKGFFCFVLFNKSECLCGKYCSTWIHSVQCLRQH